MPTVRGILVCCRQMKRTMIAMVETVFFVVKDRRALVAFGSSPSERALAGKSHQHTRFDHFKVNANLTRSLTDFA
jgi:hypothetical protein